jgi:nicotinate-nucleotide pyrophosphorylase (carboxylating)
MKQPPLICPSGLLIDRLIENALAEDVGPGDITTLATIPPGTRATAVLVGKQPGVLAGLPVARRVFEHLDPGVTFEVLCAEGEAIAAGDRLARLTGAAQALLTGERVALNFLQHLSGIATQTAALLKQLEGLPTRLVDTRKTVPGLRTLAKYAVRAGGGHNHRLGLYDAVLIKDNHITAAGGIASAVARARAVAPHTMRVEVEADTLAQVEEALAAGADIILLDNMDLDTMRRAVALCRGRALTEASGGINAATLRPAAETGVDLISVGALTHSVEAIDISLDFSATASAE